MKNDDDKKPPGDFRSAWQKSAARQSGYEKVDDSRVLERYFYPLRWREFDHTPLELQLVVTLYDFQSFTATVTRETIGRSGAVQGAPEHREIPFAAFANKRGIADAHRALVELGGHPLPLEGLLDEGVATDKELRKLKPFRFDKKGP